MSQYQQQRSEQSSAKEVTVIVNGRPRKIERGDYSYLQVIQLAYPDETPTDVIVFTVTYSYRDNRDGSLVEGQSVAVDNGMIFNVTRTDKS